MKPILKNSLFFVAGCVLGVSCTIVANSLNYVITIERRTIAYDETISLSPRPTEMQDHDDTLTSD